MSEAQKSEPAQREDPLASTPERTARYARIAYCAAIVLALLFAYLAKTLTYNTAVTTFGDGSPAVTKTFPWLRGWSMDELVKLVLPLLIALAFAACTESALKRNSRTAARASVVLAGLSVVLALTAIYGYGIAYAVPWAMALSGASVATLQVLDERAAGRS